jgi:dihydroorotate dehydrogenase (fumarate)
MNLATTYLGLPLRNPLIVGASPYSDDVKAACQLQDAGAAALVMRSLFEEQIDLEQRALTRDVESIAETSFEATSFFPNYAEYQLTPDRYLRQIEQLKQQLSIPVIPSLNGCRPGGWLEYARKFEAAGADAIELNLYQLASDPAVSSDEIEDDMLATVRSVVTTVRVPVAVKLSPFHTSLPHFVQALHQAGAAGVVLFNRFYQPDFDVEDFEVEPTLRLSDSSELLLRLRWLAILSPHHQGSLAATGGVHTSLDAAKALLSGAHAVQVVSALLKHGPRVLTVMLRGLEAWMAEHNYTHVSEFRGAMNLHRCPDPAAFERANYQRILQSWKI